MYMYYIQYTISVADELNRKLESVSIEQEWKIAERAHQTVWHLYNMYMYMYLLCMYTEVYTLCSSLEHYRSVHEFLLMNSGKAQN